MGSCLTPRNVGEIVKAGIKVGMGDVGGGKTIEVATEDSI